MPEIAEVKRASDIINTCKGIKFQKIWKNPNHKKETITLPWNSFGISAKSRGKELNVNFIGPSHEIITYHFGLGMSGGFIALPNNIEPPKYSHLTFISDDVTLYFYDKRRFGFWKERETDTWGKNRGPDPIFEHPEFVLEVLGNINKKAFKKPIYEVLMNQRYFNGIGNYLRAEILGRINDSPFQLADEYIAKHHNTLLNLCREIPVKSYAYKYSTATNYRQELFLKYYRRGSSIVDNNRRTFWFNPKWNGEAQKFLFLQENS